MIVVVAEFSVAPESREILLSAVDKMRATSVGESGCLRYDFFEDAFQPNRFSFIEEWQDMDTFLSHAKTAEMAIFQETTQALLVNRKAELHEVTSTKPL